MTRREAFSALMTLLLILVCVVGTAVAVGDLMALSR